MSDLFIGNRKIKNVNVAITDKEQTKGLMFVDWPPPVTVFPYKKPRIASIWMKNTKCPLDVIFCCNNKIIALFEGTPFDKKSFGPEEEVDLIIEAPKGFVEENNIRVGSKVRVIYGLSDLKKLLSRT